MKKTFVIGREPAQNYLQTGATPITVINSTATQHISRSHCKLTINDDGSMVIEDLNSKSGTFVNGLRLTQAQYISESSQVELGKGFVFKLDHPQIREALTQTMPKSSNQPIGYSTSSSYADWGQRLVASIVDSFIFGLIISPIAWLAFFARIVAFLAPPIFLLVIFLQFFATVVIIHFYFIVPTHRLGSSYGRRMFEIYYKDAYSNQNLSITQAWGRYLSKFFSSLFLGLGYLMPLWTERKQALHDLIAGSVVVRK